MVRKWLTAAFLAAGAATVGNAQATPAQTPPDRATVLACAVMSYEPPITRADVQTPADEDRLIYKEFGWAAVMLRMDPNLKELASYHLQTEAVRGGASLDPALRQRCAQWDVSGFLPAMSAPPTDRPFLECQGDFDWIELEKIGPHAAKADPCAALDRELARNRDARRKIELGQVGCYAPRRVWNTYAHFELELLTLRSAKKCDAIAKAT